MDIKSLMVGDWVFNKHHGKNIRLTQYDFFTHTHNEFGEQELAPFAKPTFGRDLKPIPLTPEILEKNGWESMKNGSGDFILTKPMVGNSATITKTINGYEMLHGVFNGLGIHYIHQLQHALRLCGIEKEIKLEVEGLIYD